MGKATCENDFWVTLPQIAFPPFIVAGGGSPITITAPSHLQDNEDGAPCCAQLRVAAAGTPHFLKVT